jgi:hypothetical protein
MKIKIKTDRRTGQMSAEYFIVIDKPQFRTRLLQKVLESASGEAVLMVDTNQHIAESSADEAISTLQNAGLEPLVLPIAANPQRLFGISYSTKKNRTLEKLILISLPTRQQLGEEALTALLPYDIALGIGPNKTLQELGNLLSIGTPLYGSGCFECEMYDSILCTLVRSSFDISRHIKETTDEMGI